MKEVKNALFYMGNWGACIAYMSEAILYAGWCVWHIWRQINHDILEAVLILLNIIEAWLPVIVAGLVLWMMTGILGSMSKKDVSWIQTVAEIWSSSQIPSFLIGMILWQTSIAWRWKLNRHWAQTSSSNFKTSTF